MEPPKGMAENIDICAENIDIKLFGCLAKFSDVYGLADNEILITCNFSSLVPTKMNFNLIKEDHTDGTRSIWTHCQPFWVWTRDVQIHASLVLGIRS